MERLSDTEHIAAENEQQSCYNEGNFFSLSPLLRCDKSVMGAHAE
jgi:hypothetical protein